MSTKLSKLYILVDVESTGVNFINDLVFDVSYLVSNGMKIIDRYQSFIKIDRKSLVKAKESIGHIIAIDVEYIMSNGKDHEQVCEESIQFFEKISNQCTHMYFVAHNVDFDYNMILQMLSQAKNKKFVMQFEKWFSSKRIDTIDLARSQLPGLKSYSLQRIVDHLGISIQRSELRKHQKHSAELDCEILGDLFHYLKSCAPFEDLMC